MASKIHLKFNNGLKMPALGLGTWRAPDDEVRAAVENALEAGYRHFDTAPVYLNEKTIGTVLKTWLDSGKIKREELFICTKLPPPGCRPESVEKCIRNSLKDLQLDYVDLYLIHTPFALPETSDGSFLLNEEGDLVLETTTNHVEIWKKMEEMVNLGLAKSIGLSNFNEKQIQKVLDNCCIKPVNLQIEIHVYLQQHELVDFCKKNDIVVTAYSPLGSKGIEVLLKNAGIDRVIPDLMENPLIVELGNKYNKSPGQILLRYIIERGIAAIPKSTHLKRLNDNINIFDFKLTENDLNEINKLDSNIRVCDFSFFKGITKHPEFPF